MLFKKVFVLILASLPLINLAGDEESNAPINPIQSKNPPCLKKKVCEKGSPCKCFCSRVCTYRDIQDDDDPIWKDGICYCKQWDLDKYYERCVRNQ